MYTASLNLLKQRCTQRAGAICSFCQAPSSLKFQFILVRFASPTNTKTLAFSKKKENYEENL